MALNKLRTAMISLEVQTNLTIPELQSQIAWQEVLKIYAESVSDEGGIEITIQQKPKVQVAQAPGVPMKAKSRR